MVTTPTTTIAGSDAPADVLEQQRGEEEAQPVGDGARDEEQPAGDPLHRRAEPLPEHLVGAEQVAAHVLRQQEPRDQAAADDVAEGELQEREVAALRVVRRARARSGT